VKSRVPLKSMIVCGCILRPKPESSRLSANDAAVQHTKERSVRSAFQKEEASCCTMSTPAMGALNAAATPAAPPHATMRRIDAEDATSTA